MATSAGWIPDWFGLNGRTIVPPFFQTDCVVNTINYGCYSSTQMDSLINQAEAATSPSRRGALWGQADTLAMKDAVIVPLLSQQAAVLLEYAGAQPGLGGDRLSAEHRRSGHHQRLAQPTS